MNNREGLLFCLVGPAASGKTTFARRLVEKHPECHLSISATSRDKRQGEKEGKDYFFMTRSEFEAKAKDGFFFEYEETHGNFYGTPKGNLDNAIQDGAD